MPRAGAFAAFREREAHVPLEVPVVDSSEEGRRRRMKAYWKAVRQQPGFGDIDLGLSSSSSDAEEEPRPIASPRDGVPDLPSVLAALDRHERRDRKAEQQRQEELDEARGVPRFDDLLQSLGEADVPVTSSRASFSSWSAVQRREEPDPTRVLLGEALDPVRRAVGRPRPRVAQRAATAGGARRGAEEAAVAAAAPAPAVEAKLLRTAIEGAVAASLPRGWEPCSRPGQVVARLLFRSSGVPAGSPCNADFEFESMHRGRPLYKAPTGAIIYFDGCWKMNSTYRTTSWLYGVEGAAGPLPPLGPWSAASDAAVTAGCKAPSLAAVQGTTAPCSVVAERGAQLMLEDGSCVPKRLENKAWHLVSVASTEATSTAQE